MDLDDPDPLLDYDERGDPLCRTCKQPGEMVGGAFDCIECSAAGS